MSVDLDKARAARAEAQKVGPVVILDGKEYQLRSELPFTVLDAFRGISNEETAPGALADVAAALLGEHYEEIRLKISLDDLNTLIEGVMEEYGVSNPPESSAPSTGTSAL